MQKTLLFLTLLSPQLFGLTFTHKFEGVPKKLTRCREQAAELLKTFIDQTGIITASVECTKDDGKKSDYELAYEAEKKYPFETTDLPSIFKTGLYKTKEICSERLGESTQAFETNTGLSPFVSYCKPDFDTSNPRWFPFLFAFGSAQMNYHVSGYFYSSVPYKLDGKSLIESIKTALLKNGGIFAGAVSHPSLGYGSMEIHYYSKEKVIFELIEISQSPKVEQCLQDLDRFKKSMGKTGIKTVENYCGRVSVGGYWEVTTLVSGKTPFSKLISIETFESFDQCEGNRASLTEYYLSSINDKIIEGFCGRIEEAYRVIFLKK